MIQASFEQTGPPPGAPARRAAFRAGARLLRRLPRGVGLALKCGISAALIAWIIRGSNPGEVLGTIGSARLWPLAAAFAMNFLVTHLRAYRWQLLLGAQGVHASVATLFKASMVSYFFSNFLPSTVGGDSVRIYDSWRLGRSKWAAVAVIVVDRFLGTAAMLAFVLGGLAIPNRITQAVPFLRPGILLGAAVTFAAGWMMLGGLGRGRHPWGVGLWIARKIPAKLDTILQAFQAFRNQRGVMLKALGLSLILQAIVVIHYYLLAVSLEIAVPLGSFFLIIPLAMLIMMVPVSINAIGVREGVFVLLFARFGVPSTEALAFAWLMYGIFLVMGLLGGVVYALRK